MEVEVILLIEYPNLVSELENANYQISTEIKNILTKGNVHRYLNVLYIVYNQLHLKNKTRVKQNKNRRKVRNKIIKLKMIYMKIENSESRLIKRGTYENI